MAKQALPCWTSVAVASPHGLLRWPPLWLVWFFCCFLRADTPWKGPEVAGISGTREEVPPSKKP